MFFFESIGVDVLDAGWERCGEALWATAADIVGVGRDQRLTTVSTTDKRELCGDDSSRREVEIEKKDQTPTLSGRTLERIGFAPFWESGMIFFLQYQHNWNWKGRRVGDVVGRKRLKS